MEHLDTLRETLPDVARDIKLNLQTVLQQGPLTPAQMWGVAAASAHASRCLELTRATLADATAAGTDASVLEDAKASAILMAMNNVMYRFRHVIDNEAYSQKPARLRMSRLVQVASNKPDFELFSLAVSSINNCEACVRAHEVSAKDGGISEDQIYDAIRIASVFHATAVALDAR